jgi:hypothetical protein
MIYLSLNLVEKLLGERPQFPNIRTFRYQKLQGHIWFAWEGPGEKGISPASHFEYNRTMVPIIK